MQSSTITSRRHVFVLAVVVSLLVAAGLRFGVLAAIEGQSWDWRVRVAARAERHDAAIKILMIDQTSVDWFVESCEISWPWPRSM